MTDWLCGKSTHSSTRRNEQVGPWVTQAQGAGGACGQGVHSAHSHLEPDF